MVGAFFEAAIQVGARKPGSDAEDIVLVACSVFARETALHSAEKTSATAELQAGSPSRQRVRNERGRRGAKELSSEQDFSPA